MRFKRSEQARLRSVARVPLARERTEAVPSRAERTDATAFASAHDQFGNHVVHGALGDAASLTGEGFGPALGAHLTLASVGVAEPTFGPNTSNAATLALLRRRDANGVDRDDPAVGVIGRLGGQPLPDAIRERMEAAFGRPFDHVRVHVGGSAAAASDALGARAFTVGTDVYFGAGEWAPDSPKFERLLAHELTHVVQADEGRLGAPTGEGLDVSRPTDATEREAYANEVTIARELATLDGAPEALSPELAVAAPAAGGAPASEGAILRDAAPGVDVSTDRPSPDDEQRRDLDAGRGPTAGEDEEEEEDEEGADQEEHAADQDADTGEEEEEGEEEGEEEAGQETDADQALVAPGDETVDLDDEGGETSEGEEEEEGPTGDPVGATGPTAEGRSEGGPTPVAPTREPIAVPEMDLGTWKADKEVDAKLKEQTGRTAAEHRQQIERELTRITDDVTSRRDALQAWGELGVEQMEESLAELAGQATARGQANRDNVAAAWERARGTVTAARDGALAGLESAAAATRARLEQAVPAAQSRLATTAAGVTGRLAELTTAYIGHFRTMLEEESAGFERVANEKADGLASQKEAIVNAVGPDTGSWLVRAQNEARRKAAARGVDEAVRDFRRSGPTNAAQCRSQLPAFEEQIRTAAQGVQTWVDEHVQQANEQLEAAKTQGLQTVESQRAQGTETINGAHASATATIDERAAAAGGEIDAAAGRVAESTAAAAAEARSQAENATVDLLDASAEWLQGVYDGIPKDQVVPFETLRPYLETRAREAGPFHEDLVRRLEEALAAARATYEQAVSQALAQVDAVASQHLSAADALGQQQAANIQGVGASSAQAINAAGNAVDQVVRQWVDPFAAQIEARVGQTEAALDQRKETSRTAIQAQVTAFGTDLDTRIAEMPQRLRPSTDAAAAAVRPDLVRRAQEVHSACAGLGTDENRLNNALRGLTARSGPALEHEVWGQLFAAEGSLRAYVDDDTDGTDQEIALAYLAGDTARGARLELDNSMHWYGDDEAQIETILRSLDPADLAALQNEPGWQDTRSRLMSNLDGTDLNVTQALLAGNTARADAYRLRDRIDEARRDGDADALHEALQGIDPANLAAVQQEFHHIRNGVAPDATNAQPIDPAVAARELGAYATREERGMRNITGANRDLANALATEGRDSEAAAVSRFEVERTREGGPRMENMERALYAPPDLQERLHSPDPAVRQQAQQEQNQREASIRQRYQAQYGGPQGRTMDQAIDGMFQNEDQAETSRRVLHNMLSDGTNTPRVAADLIHLATERAGTDEAQIRRALAGMRPDEARELAVEYGRLHGDGPGDTGALYEQLGVVERNADGSRGADHSGFGSELSGDERREVEELLMGDPRYMNTREQLALARLRNDWVAGEEAGGVSSFLNSGSAERADFDRNYQALEDVAGRMRPDGTFADPADAAAFERLSGDLGVNAAQYRAAQDRMANYVTTTIAVVGAVVVTAVTAGGGAPIAAAMIGAAVTGGATMAANSAIRGGRYGWESATTDLAVTAVSVATAGVGAKLQAGVSSALQSGAITNGGFIARQVGIGAGTGFVNGAFQTATTDGTWDRGFGAGLRETALGGGRQALMDGASAGVSNGIERSRWGQAMEQAGGWREALMKGTSSAAGGATSATAGTLVDAGRGRFRGDWTDAVGNIAMEAGKQGLTNAVGTRAGQRFRTPAPTGGNPPPAPSQDSGTGPNVDGPTPTPTPDGPTPTPDGPAADTGPTPSPARPATETGPTGPTADSGTTPTADTTAALRPTGSEGPTQADPSAPRVDDGSSSARAAADDVARTPTGGGDGGNQAQVHTDGDHTVVTSRDRTVMSDGESVASRESDGTIEVAGRDGTITTIDPDGNTRTMLPDGTAVVSAPGGRNVAIGPDGTTVLLDAQGRPVQGDDPATREANLVSRLDALERSGRITPEDSYRVLSAGDDAETALQAAVTHREAENTLLNRMVELTSTPGPDGRPLLDTDEALRVATESDDPQRALAYLEARASNNARDADLRGNLESAVQTRPNADGTGDERYVPQLFDNITAGAGFAGISNEMHQRQMNPDGNTLVVGEDNPWLQSTARLGQRAGESELPGVRDGMRMQDTATSGDDPYMLAAEHARNVEMNRADQGIGVYQRRIVRVEPIPDGETPPVAGARARVVVETPDGELVLYTRRADLAAGPGTGRGLITGGRNGPEIDPALYESLRARGVIIDGDQSFGAHRINDGESVVVYGAGASGAWAVESARTNASEVTWLGRMATPDDPRLNRTEQQYVQRLHDAIRESRAQLARPDITPREQATAARRLDRAMESLETFTFERSPGNGNLPRNQQPGAAFDRSIYTDAGGNVDRRSAFIEQGGANSLQSVTYELNPATGRQQLRLVPAGGGDAIWADRLVLSIGQDGNAAGGPARLLQNVESLSPIIDTSGDIPAVVGLQSGDGAVRVLGAAATSPSLRNLVVEGTRGMDVNADWVRSNMGAQASHESVPVDSRGVVGSFRHAMDMIRQANRGQLIDYASLSADEQRAIFESGRQEHDRQRVRDESRPVR